MKVVPIIMDPVLDVPIMNASGVHCTMLEELRALGRSDCDAMVTKSMTLEPRGGNPEPRFFASDEFTINSMGLPNPGVGYYVEHAGELAELGKPLTANVAALRTEDFLPTLSLALPHFDRFEVNLSCPNIGGKGVFAYDFELLESILSQLRASTDKPLGIKLPVYTQLHHITQVARILRATGMDFITLVNGFGTACAIDIDNECMAIKPNGGIGGMGGGAIKPIALAHIALFRHELGDEMPIIGVGGIASGEDAYAFVLAGASALQIGSALWTEGLGIFTRVKDELRAIMRQKGIEKLSDKIGMVGQCDSPEARLR